VNDFYQPDATFTPASVIYLKVTQNTSSHHDRSRIDRIDSVYLDSNAVALNSDGLSYLIQCFHTHPYFQTYLFEFKQQIIGCLQRGARKPATDDPPVALDRAGDLGTLHQLYSPTPPRISTGLRKSSIARDDQKRCYCVDAASSRPFRNASVILSWSRSVWTE
jgi:hypothetical protein